MIKNYLGEFWVNIKEYAGLYKISNFHRVKSLNFNHTGKEKILDQRMRGKYLAVTLHKDGVAKTHSVHKLMADAFIPNPKHLPCINHRDCNTLNNRLSNLEYCTYKYNNNYGEHKQKQREAHLASLETNKRAESVYQYSTTGVLINKWVSIRRAAEALGINQSNISKCCNGKYHIVGGFIWRYKKEVDETSTS